MKRPQKSLETFEPYTSELSLKCTLPGKKGPPQASACHWIPSSWVEDIRTSQTLCGHGVLQALIPAS